MVILDRRIIIGAIAFLVIINLFFSQYGGYYYKYEDALSYTIKHSDRGRINVIKTIWIGNEPFTFINDDVSNTEVVSYQNKTIFGIKGWMTSGIESTGNVNSDSNNINENKSSQKLLPFIHPITRIDYRFFNIKDTPKILYTGTISKDEENTFSVDGKKPVFIDFIYKGSYYGIWYEVKDNTQSPPDVEYS